ERHSLVPYHTSEASLASSAFHCTLRVQMLQRLYPQLPALQRGDAFGCRSSGRESRYGWNPRLHRRAPDRLLIKPGIDPVWRITDQVNALALDEVHDVRPSFFYLVNPLYRHARSLKHVGGTRRGHQLEAHVHKLARDFRHTRFVVIGDADEHHALRGQFLSGCGLRLGEGFAEVVGHTHDFAG